MGRILAWGLGIAGVLALLIAGALIALTRADIPTETLAKTYATPASQWVEMGDGLALHFRDQGAKDARPIVLIHGFTASLDTWEPWVKELGGQYRIISLDLPGHGLTRTPEGYQPSMEGYADLVDAFLAKQGIARAAVAGSSMGGHVAWQLALRHPARVEALVLVDAAGWPEGGDDWEEPLMLKALRNPTLGPVIMNLDATSQFRQGLRGSFYDPAMATDAMVARYAAMARGPNHRAVIAALVTGQFGRSPATPELMAQIKAPTLVLHGEADQLIPVSSGRQFAETIAGAAIVTYPKVGHMPQEEVPAQSAKDLAGFLARHPPTPPAGALIGPPAAQPAQAPLEGVY